MQKVPATSPAIQDIIISMEMGPDVGYNLRKLLPEAGMNRDEEWVEILMTYDSLEAEMIRDLLESGGIPVVLRSLKVSPYPVNIGKMGEIRILVRKEDKEAAVKVIRGENDTPGPSE
jgi:hypothetical protein